MKSCKILIADDNQSFRKRLKSILTDYPDFRIAGEAEDGFQVLKESRRLKPDLILMDVSMPGLNGLDTLKKLRKNMPHIKIIMLSVYDMDAYRKAAQENGADRYLIKKDMIDHLMPAIKSVLKKH